MNKTLYVEPFHDLDAWHNEGVPGMRFLPDGGMLLECIGSRQGSGRSCALFVNDRPGPAFVDPGTLPDEIPSSGKVGFRAIGSRVRAEIRDFRVSSIR